MSGDQPSSTRRIFPIEQLPAVPTAWRRPLLALWGLMLAATLIFSGIDIWRQWHQNNAIERPLTQVAMTEIESNGRGAQVDVAAPAAIRAGVRSPARILAVDGVALPANASIDAVAAALDGPPGKVKVTFASPTGAAREVELDRGPEVLAANADGWLFGWPRILLIIMRTIPVVALALCSALLLIRRPDDALAALLSFGFISYALSFGGMLGYEWANLPTIGPITSALSLALLTAALPAFPSGRYRSSFGALYAPLVCLLVLLAALSDAELAEGLGVAFVFSAGLFALVRFLSVPPGVERQQLKWAGLGLSISLVILLAVAIILSVLEGYLTFAQYQMADNFGEAIAMLCATALPLCITIGLLRIWLWDADRAIVRSATITTLTAALGAVWTGLTNLSNDLLGTVVGPDNKAVMAGGSALVAAAVINPLRGKVTGWVDKRFQGGILALKGIPDKLRDWQLSDTPEEAGDRVLRVLTGKLKATAAALAVHEPGGYRLVSLHQSGKGEPVIEADVAVWLDGIQGPDAKIESVSFDDPLFAYRVPLEDHGRPIGLLMVARRPGGVGLASDELSALKGLATPLAAALRLALRREQRDKRLERALTGQV